MDHIGTVVNPHLPEISVPCMLSADNEELWYDILGFEHFPARQNVDKRQLILGKLNDVALESHDTFASFIQSWLWFGLLSSFLGDKYPMRTLMKDFVRTVTNTGQRVLTTEKLETYIQGWRRTLTAEDVQHQSPAMKHIDSILVETNRHVSAFMCRPTKGGTYLDLHPMRKHQELSLGIMCLGFVLTFIKRQVWLNSEILNWGGSELILERMTSAGWCPSDITMLERLMSSPGMYFASLMRPRVIGVEHGALCDTNHCGALNVTAEVKATYRSKHVAGCDQQCRALRVDEADLGGILQKPGSIPLVRYEPAKIIDDNLLLVESSRVDDFVAISHVWIEGLGNPFDNALPECQLVRIQRLIDKVAGQSGTYFWMDTLCVPQDEGRLHLTALRREAIKSMNQVYQKSSYVLVLDAELQNISVQTALEERLIRLVCSNWIRRLWTLQEAVSGPKIVLQFSDGTLDLFNHLVRAMQDSQVGGPLTSTILLDLGAFLAGMQSLVEEHPPRARMGRLINACMFRTTSESQDEALCLSIIAGLSLNQIVDAHPSERWRRFLVAQRVFPIELLFSPGPRMDIPGFRWAPPSIIRRPYEATSYQHAGYGIGEADDNGFSLRACGLAFDSPTIPFRHSDPSFWVYLPQSDTWITIMQKQIDRQSPGAWKLLVERLRGFQKLAVILQNDLTRHQRGTDRSPGVLVGWENTTASATEDTSVIQCSFLATVNTMLEYGVQQLAQLPDIRKYCFKEVLPSEDTWIADATLMSDRQRWCVT